MEIKINQSDLRKVNKLFDKLEDISEKQANIIIDKNGLSIVRQIKQPPIPVDTGNLRNNVVYNANEKAIESKAPYSGFLEFGTKFQKAQPYFFSKINIGLKRLSLDLNNAILRSMK
jgi:HK97 gp10 family phage protein